MGVIKLTKDNVVITVGDDWGNGDDLTQFTNTHFNGAT